VIIVLTVQVEISLFGKDKIKNAVGKTVGDLVNSGIKASFTKEELDSF
jgi:hypothetical protein